MDSPDPGSVPSESGTPDWRALYDERAEANIAYEAARAAACSTRQGLLVEHAAIPPELRDAVVAQVPEYQAALDRRLDAYARVERARARVDHIESELRRRKVEASSWPPDLRVEVAELHQQAATALRRFDVIMRQVQEVADRTDDR